MQKSRGKSKIRLTVKIATPDNLSLKLFTHDYVEDNKNY